jgi:nicotinate phosphoribosyltransferase
VGFVATSNVEAARRFGLRVAGTMAHSYIEAFPSEAEAFRAFAEDFPGRTTFLVDTYDTPNGVRTAIETARELGLTENIGVRLDSGNLLELSRTARDLLDEAGFPDARIFASGGLDELEVEELVSGGAPVDAFGIGTQMGVSADAPYIDSVYKLVEYDGRPVLKLSSKKATAPGPKQVFRGFEGDLLALRDEPGPPGAEPLLDLVMRRGSRVSASPSMERMRERFRHDLAGVPQHALRLRDPGAVMVRHSGELVALTNRAREEALRRAGLPS